MHIIISEFMDEDAVQVLSRKFDVRYEPDLVDRREDLVVALPLADALIVRNRTQVDAALLEHAGRLKVVGRLGVGLDNIATGLCAARGIDVIPATGANARAVAEYVIATTLLLLRGAYGASAEVASGTWPRTAYSNGLEASGRTLGVIGFGGIGQLVASLANCLGMKVVGHDPMLGREQAVWRDAGVACMSQDDVLACADVVSLHVPLTDQTRGLIGSDALAKMRDGAILINTARGGIVDEAALADALRSGKLRGAALDVFAGEPLTSGVFVDVPNLILTPHIAGLTHEANQRVSSIIAERVARVLDSVVA